MARILYVGQLFDGSSAALRAESLALLGHEVARIDVSYPRAGLERLEVWLRRRWRLGRAHPSNGAVLESLACSGADVLWVDKGTQLTHATLEQAHRWRPGLRAIHYSPDDYRIPGNWSADLAASLPAYDVVVTTKRHNLDWLAARGATRVLFGWQGYDPAMNRPPDPSEVDPTLAGRIVLVGSWEAERAATVEALARAGLPVTVLSNFKEWAASTARAPSLEWRNWHAYGRAYSVALGCAAIALGALRKAADDQHTQRSLEIPSCGTVLLAERTEEHQAMFEEGVEAEFYSDDEECVSKARRLLEELGRLRSMAEAGRRRCHEGGYSWAERLRSVLEAVGVASPAPRIS